MTRRRIVTFTTGCSTYVSVYVSVCSILSIGSIAIVNVGSVIIIIISIFIILILVQQQRR